MASTLQHFSYLWSFFRNCLLSPNDLFSSIELAYEEMFVGAIQTLNVCPVHVGIPLFYLFLSHISTEFKTHFCSKKVLSATGIANTFFFLRIREMLIFKSLIILLLPWFLIDPRTNVSTYSLQNKS